MNEKLIEKCRLTPEKVAEIVTSIHSDPLFDKILPIEPRRYRKLIDEQVKKAIPLIAREVLGEADRFVKQNTFGGIVRSHHFRVEAWQNFKQALRTKYGVEEVKND